MAGESNESIRNILKPHLYLQSQFSNPSLSITSAEDTNRLLLTADSLNDQATVTEIDDENTNENKRNNPTNVVPPNIHSASSDATQLHTVPDDIASSESANSLFPIGVHDVNGQQVDLRSSNSWTLRLAEVSTSEAAECMAINALAPFVINARLRKLMEACGPDEYKYIVNVSAMEGKFYRFKTDKHPHTNMAKAALNMMTRTSAQDYFKSNIFMTAVDTGWINDEKPIEKAESHARTHHFQTPLDEEDAASRVLDPIFSPIAHNSKLEPNHPDRMIPPYGYFIKDYVKCEW